MKKTISAFVAGLVVASIPYLLLTRADAQGAGPGQRGQGQFQGGPAQLPPGQGGPGQGGQPGQPGFGMQQAPPVSAITMDNDHLYASAGNIIYKVNKTSMRVEGQVALLPQQRGQRQPPGNGGGK